MKEFKTLGPTQFGVGDGVKTRFSVARPGDIVRDSNIESVRRVGWQGDQLLRPYPRTNLAIASNDFTNSAWQGSPSIYMDFLSGTMPSSVDFSRASTATYVGRDRLIHTAAINEPRFTYDPATGEPEGLLVEGRSTNLLLWSEDLSAWNCIRSTAQLVQIPNPTGALGVHKLTESDQTGWMYAIPPASSVSSGVVYTLTFFAKAGERRYLQPNLGASVFGDSNAHNAAVFDLEDGVVVAAGSGLISSNIEAVQGGWYKCSISKEAVDATASNPVIFTLRNEPSISISGYQGDGTSGIYIWGAQLEEGTRPTSYIPTEDSQVTRIADTPIIPVGDWFNPNEGTFVVEGEAQPRGTGDNQNIAPLLKVGDSLSSADALVIDRIGGTNNYFVQSRAINEGHTALNLGNPSGIVKIAMAYTAGGDMRAVLSGGDVVTGTNNWDGAGDFLYIGAGGLSGIERGQRRANGPISRITYYPRALSNEQLQALTS